MSVPSTNQELQAAVEALQAENANLEARLHNLEVAVTFLGAAIEQIAPQHVAKGANRCMSEFFEASGNHGAFKDQALFQ